MIITNSSLQALRTGFNASYQKGLGMSAPQHEKIATTIPSSTASNTYGWFGQWPAFREWIGDRVLNDLKEHGHTISNKSFESSVAVDRDHIEDDQLGQYSAMFEEMGRAAGVFPDELMFSLLAAGFDNTCFDGKKFFAEDHPVYPKADGSGTKKNVSNTLVDAEYTGAPWFLLDTSRALKPLIYQLRKKPVFTHMVDDKDESVFMRKEYRYGVDLRANGGYGFWQMGYGVKADLVAETFIEAFSKMREFKADGGRPLGIKPKTLVVPASLEWKAKELLERELIVTEGGTVSNILKGSVELLVADYL